MNLLEVCVDNFDSAILAEQGGADRLEICQNLLIGGLTPTAGFVSVVRKLVSIPIYVLIRPRPGNFCFNSYEVKQMIEDIRISRKVGADGFVFGALDSSHNVDVDVCRQLLVEAAGMPSTFHRAFDVIKDKSKALEIIIDLGFDRILTSGWNIFEDADPQLNGTAMEGIKTLHELILQAENRIIIIPGGNVNDENIQYILENTNAREYHSSARKKVPLSPKSISHVCSKEIVQKMKKTIKSSITENPIVH